jgi:hypothetical protein
MRDADRRTAIRRVLIGAALDTARYALPLSLAGRAFARRSQVEQESADRPRLALPDPFGADPDAPAPRSR